MPVPSFEFQPFPRGLYTADALSKGFDPAVPATFATMRDTLIYREFIAGGGAASGDYLTMMSRALHDTGISQALADLGTGEAAPRIAAIMGGHGASRRDPIYAETARLSAKLTEAGLCVASGGGPGIMEAAHLGAAFGADTGLDEALAALAAPDVPERIPADAGQLVGLDGTINAGIAEALGRYLAPAVLIRQRLGRGGGLGVPTWLYGHEPTTVFAAQIAKYFQNSLREDGLLALATNGVIYMPGSAGTLQEVFQDAAQNFYRTYPMGPGKTGMFSPMVFFGDVWVNKMPVKPVLDALFLGSGVEAEYRDRVWFTTDADDVVARLSAFSAPPSPALQATLDTAAAQGQGGTLGSS